MSEKLAIHGGPKTVPDGTVKPWPPIDDTDRDMVIDALYSYKLPAGPHCQAFEKEFAEWNGSRLAITTNSGTAALHMCVAACGLGEGDHVLVPAYTWTSSATCILHHNAIPVFVDIDFDTINMDVDKLEAAVTPATKAILVVHLHGLAVDMDKVLAVAKKHNLKVIEDCCQSHGATFHGQKVGTFGDCAAFSLNQNKCLCAGEGGIFVTDDDNVHELAKQLWSFGETRTPYEDRDYHAYALGWMYRNNDLIAAMARAQLAKLDGYMETLQANAARLIECLQGTPHLILPTAPEGYGHNWYNYTMRFDMDALGHADDAAEFRGKITAALTAEGVENGVWQSYPLPAMTVFRAKNAYGHGSPWSHADPVDYSMEQFPVAVRHADWHTGMTTPLRAPNTPDVAELTAQGIRKVMENIDQL